MIFIDEQVTLAMKVLVSTYVFPDIWHSRTATFNNIFSSLKNKTDLDVFWVVYQPDEFQSSNPHDVSLLDIHDFDSAVSLLKNTSPDCVLITSALDVIQYALCVAAKHLKIPIFSINIFDKTYVNSIDSNSVYKDVKRAISMFLSNKVSTDTPSQYKFLRRGRFVMYKNKFLFNTLLDTGISFINSLLFLCKKNLIDITGKSKYHNDLADYHLLPNDDWIQSLIELGIRRESIIVTGNPYWENFTKVANPINEEISPRDTINVLIVTTSLLQHNLWPEKQINDLISNLVLNLRQDPKINFSFKIHPSSENKQHYSKLFGDYSNQIRIFQWEKLSNILSDFDLVISYGNTSAQTEIIARQVKMILIDLKINIPQASLVKEGNSCGLVTICETTDDIVKIIHDCIKKKIIISDDLTAKCNALFSKNNEPSNQIADIIIKKLCKGSDRL